MKIRENADCNLFVVMVYSKCKNSVKLNKIGGKAL